MKDKEKTAQTHQKQHQQHLAGQQKAEISVPPPNSRLNPGKDFYKYVNLPWLDRLHMPPYISSYGLSEEIEKLISFDLIDLIKKCISKWEKGTAKPYEEAVGIMGESVLGSTRHQESIRLCRAILGNFSCIRDEYDIASTIGEMARYKMRGLIWMGGKYLEGRKSGYTLVLDVGSLGLPDLSYYKKLAPGKGRTLLQYISLLNRLGKELDIPMLSSIVALETEMAPILRKSLDQDEVRMKGSSLASEFSGIPWEAFFATYDLPKWKDTEFIVNSTLWLEYVEKLIRKMPIEMWKLLFASEFLLTYLYYLPPPFDNLHFEFFRKKLRGQTEKTPQKELAIDVLADYMTPFISRLYVEEFLTKKMKEETVEFAREIRAAAEARLLASEWLAPETRKKAKEKVEKMELAICYPDAFANLKPPKGLISNNLLNNLLVMGAWRTEYEIARQGEKQENQKDWDDPVFAVNAYYYPEANELVLPAGSVQWPFYSKTAPLGWNYGGLGATLGHEITHAFDEEGKDFSPTGQEEVWWTQADNRAYNKRIRILEKLFSRQRVLGQRVSGALTLSENIADLGGVALALDALKARMKKEGIAENSSQAKEAYRQFFLSYAVSWRVKEKPAKILQSLFLDKHAPPFLRVNMIVSQFDEWYFAFNVDERDSMFLPADQRVRIF